MRWNMKEIALRRYFVLFLMLCGSFSLPAFAQNPAVSDQEKELSTAQSEKLVADLKAVADKTTSIAADFTEEKYLSFMKEPQLSEGKFYYAKENKMRWEQTKPFAYILLVNEDMVRISEDGVEKDTGPKMVMKKIKELMMGMVNGDLSENKQYKPLYFQDKTAYIVKLMPQNKRLKSYFDHIELRFSPDALRLKSLSFYETSGDKRIMKFHDERFNEQLSNDLFAKF